MSEMRLIDANALKILPDRFKNYYRVVGARGDGKSFQTMTLGVLAKVQEAIDNAPTIDAVPVVHGRWVETGKVFVHSMYDLFTKCSLCSFGHVRNECQEPYRYCPNCGARMDGGAEG